MFRSCPKSCSTRAPIDLPAYEHQLLVSQQWLANHFFTEQKAANDHLSVHFCTLLILTTLRDLGVGGLQV
eukprot:2563155-Amphidinium_carterae.1